MNSDEIGSPVPGPQLFSIRRIARRIFIIVRTVSRLFWKSRSGYHMRTTSRLYGPPAKGGCFQWADLEGRLSGAGNLNGRNTRLFDKCELSMMRVFFCNFFRCGFRLGRVCEFFFRIGS